MLLELNKLNKIYPNGVHAAKDISLNVRKGEFLVLLGLSGSGKSTLLRCINRLIEPTSGEVFFQGKNVTTADKGQLRLIRRHIGMIFQQFNLIRNLSVLTNVLTGKLGYLSLHRSVNILRNHEDVKIALQNINRVGLTSHKNEKVCNLSGGQQQRVAIARALMQKPDLILADEPVASLDPATSDSVMQYLGELNMKDGITIICSLHFLSLVRKYSSRVVALKDGEIVFDGSPLEIDETRFREIYGEQAEEVEIR
ncbi:MAG: phosphonate ABC transporter ATP-binding protein [Candidatus Cloacimonetes bacterium]|nr:phosphonate ABC transporter ATP-binding protein [Candidatus Cloacimonadota bacterium]